MTLVVKHPSILWAQRAGQIFLTIEDGGLKIDELCCEDDKFKLKGEKGGNKYEADLVLYGKLKGAERRKIETDRRIEFVIPKETEEWWPRLLKVSGKVPWIKIDFDKWKDQDEDDKDDMRDMDFSSFGLPGGGGKGYDDLDLGDDDHDYDDEMGDLEDVDDENEGIPKEGKKAEKDGKDEGKDSATNGELVDDGKEKKVVEEAKE
uniref:CS domain-containing protein n=2 Tax=Meloidogyne TaxID=189290 RepID=A0A914P433_MELIC|nr:unnamed protein product [Meloidogyne enterolobii]